MKNLTPIYLLLFFLVACQKHPSRNINPAQDVLNLLEASKSQLTQTDSALNLIIKAQEIAHKHGLTQYRASILNQKGRVYVEKNLLLEALECHLSVIMSTQKANEVAYANHQLGVLYTRMKQYDRAINHLQGALKYYTKANKNNWLVLSHFRLGKAYLLKQEFHQAENSFQASLRYAEKSGYDLMIQYNLDRLAEVCSKTGRFIEAKSYIKAMRERFQLENPPALISYLLLLGNTAEELAQPKEAAQYYDQAAAVIRQHPDNHLYLYGMYTYGNYLQRHQKDGITIWKEALNNYQVDESKYTAELVALSQALGNWYMNRQQLHDAAPFIQLSNRLQSERVALLSNMETQYNLAQIEQVQKQVAAQYAPSPSFWQNYGMYIVVAILIIYGIVLSVAYRNRYVKLQTYRKLVMQLIKPHVEEGR